jgi:hypothetical protein
MKMNVYKLLLIQSCIKVVKKIVDITFVSV